MAGSIQRGFTLLELMLAITIGALVLSTVYAAFSAGIDTQRRIMRVAGETQAWRIFSERLRVDLHNLALSSAALSGDADRLTLHSVPPGKPLRQISYRYRSSTDGGQIRRAYRAPGADQDDAETLVFDDVDALAFRYLLDGQWRDRSDEGEDNSDDNASASALPQAIECTVTRDGRERRLIITIEIERAAAT